MCIYIYIYNQVPRLLLGPDDLPRPELRRAPGEASPVCHYLSLSISLSLSIYIYIHVYMYIYIYNISIIICVYIYIYIYICLYGRLPPGILGEPLGLESGKDTGGPSKDI